MLPDTILLEGDTSLETTGATINCSLVSTSTPCYEYYHCHRNPRRRRPLTAGTIHAGESGAGLGESVANI
ncbi:hypothetical protein E2C01_042061 [Portunus trituberculatus]|uniref:Uncharacterized protein n=1 Tax=Portunus trituberculatus TaxID=210409 RepID=A0A5B7FTL2_PORTR|nr:hypothetical protein [Portunus trituberculatus]